MGQLGLRPGCLGGLVRVLQRADVCLAGEEDVRVGGTQHRALVAGRLGQQAGGLGVFTGLSQLTGLQAAAQDCVCGWAGPTPAPGRRPRATGEGAELTAGKRETNPAG